MKPDSAMWAFMITQAGAGLVWLGSVTARLAGLERQIAPLLLLDSRLATIEADGKATRRDISRLYRVVAPHADHSESEEP